MDDSTNTEISPVPSDGQSSEANRSAYWRANLKIMMGLLVIWFSVSFGCGILFVDALNEIQFFGWQLGFWFSQQGAIYVFVILIFVYVVLMNRLDRRFGLLKEDD